MVTGSTYRQQFSEHLEAEHDPEWMGDMRDFIRLVFQDKKALKWTLLIACRGGVFQHSLNSYYPDTRDGLASTHKEALRNNSLLVQIKESHLEKIGWTAEVDHLRDRRDPDTDMDMERTAELNLRSGISDVRIKKIVRTISDVDETEHADSVELEETIDQIVSEDWIFLTALGEEVYQSLFGTGGSLRVSMELMNTQFPTFLQSLPKITQIGDNRWVPDPYRFALDEPELRVFEYQKSNRRNGLSRAEERTIRKSLVETLTDCEEATVLLPWIPDERVLEQLYGGTAEYTVVFDNSVVSKYTQEPLSRELLDVLFPDGDEDGTSLARRLEATNNTYLATDARIPYLLIHTTAPDGGQLTLYAMGGINHEPNRVFMNADETGDDDSLYQWGAELVEEITDHAHPFEESVAEQSQ